MNQSQVRKHRKLVLLMNFFKYRLLSWRLNVIRYLMDAAYHLAHRTGHQREISYNQSV